MDEIERQSEDRAWDTARMLAEALPYIQVYDRETVVIKYGGHAMGEESVAKQFAADVVSSPDIAEAMFPGNELPPVNLELQDKLGAENPEVIKIAELAAEATPMPAIPEMAAIWQPLGQAEANIVGGADPESTMVSAGEEIVGQIG